MWRLLSCHLDAAADGIPEYDREICAPYADAAKLLDSLARTTGAPAVHMAAASHYMIPEMVTGMWQQNTCDLT